ncbi:Major Facilitator [Gracilaria domingensis]|nr:Major Facilitator [Gracilaria domingensis]
MCGVAVSYSAQVNLGTSQLLLLGLSERAVSLAWLAGPLSGLIVQPIVGHFSDRCTSPFGRRRPFLVAGAVLTATALLLFANAALVAEALGASDAALPLAIVAFFLLDFSVQAVQGPLRALITEFVPRNQRHVGNAFIGVFTGLGNLLGSVFTAVGLADYLPYFDHDVQAVFALAAFILLFTVAISVCSTKEAPVSLHQYESIAPESTATSENRAAEHVQDSSQTPGGSFMYALRNLPQPYWRVFTIQLCTWCGFFALFVYVNAWVGKNIYLGDGTAPAGSDERETFEEGVRLGGKGNALTAAVTLVYSLALPTLMRRFGSMPIYAASQIVEAAVLMVAPFIRGTKGRVPSQTLKAITVTDIGLFGIVWGTTMGVPWTLIGNALESKPWYRDRVGLFQMIFNASQSGPQLIVAIIAPLILALFNDDPAAVMFFGGVLALVGAVLIVLLRVGKAPAVSERSKVLLPVHDFGER